MSIEDSVLGFVMAGGNGNRLKLLTKDRCKPDLEIIGRYRIFDFVASNIINTGLPVSLVATQFKPESLCAHIKKTWEKNRSDTKFEIINPNEEGSSIARFEGTADSVRKSIDIISKYDPEIILVLAADHIYFMNYKDAIMQHKMNNADITIMANVIPDSKVKDFGILKIDDSGRIVDFAEKPTDQDVIDSFRLAPWIKNRLCIEEPNMNFLASMGNYIFNWDRLKKFLDFPGVDFGKDIIPTIKDNGGLLYAYIFNGYWRDVGKIRDYFDCNMEFASKPRSLLESWIGIHEELLHPPQIDSSSSIRRTVLSSGNVISQKNSIVDSVLGKCVVIEEGCKLHHCILLGADTNCNIQANIVESAIRIGKGSCLNKVIFDRNVWVGENVHIDPHNGTPEKRKKILQSIGLKPYRKVEDGEIEGDFYIEPETGILIIGKQQDADPKEPILPNGLRC
ncbi:MAG: sugar phosphate nucleotidyltransferase [Candidatus Poribacteria bacterium]